MKYIMRWKGKKNIIFAGNGGMKKKMETTIGFRAL